MNIPTEEQLTEFAAEIRLQAGTSAADNALGLFERLGDKFEGFNDLHSDQQEQVMERLADLIRESEGPLRRAMVDVLATMRRLEVAEKAGGRFLSALAYQGAAELLDAALNPPSDDEDEDPEPV